MVKSFMLLEEKLSIHFDNPALVETHFFSRSGRRPTGAERNLTRVCRESAIGTPRDPFSR